jgi:hypothetical protein
LSKASLLSHGGGKKREGFDTLSPNGSWSLLNRRVILGSALLAGSLAAQPAAAPVVYPEVTAGTPISLPRDHGAHPDHRIDGGI